MRVAAGGSQRWPTNNRTALDAATATIRPTPSRPALLGPSRRKPIISSQRAVKAERQAQRHRRLAERRAGEQGVEEVGLKLDARHQAVVASDRGRELVAGTGCGRADQHIVSGEHAGRRLAAQHADKGRCPHMSRRSAESDQDLALPSQRRGALAWNEAGQSLDEPLARWTQGGRERGDVGPALPAVDGEV